MHHTAKSVLTVMAVVALVSLATMSPAAALGTMVKYNKNNVQIRATPHKTAALRGYGQKSHKSVCVWYLTTGDSVGGSTTWGYLDNWSIGVNGYSPGSRMNYLVNPDGSYKTCAYV